MKTQLMAAYFTLTCLSCIAAVPATAATDSQTYGLCKRAAENHYGTSSKVKLVRLKRYAGEVKVKLEVRNVSLNEGRRFRVQCLVSRDGEISLEKMQ